jgi:hypothetical protein
MISLKKLVITKTIDGAKTRIVKTTKRFKLVTSCCGVSGALKLRLTVGIGSAPKSVVKKTPRRKSFFT